MENPSKDSRSLPLSSLITDLFLFFINLSKSDELFYLGCFYLENLSYLEISFLLITHCPIPIGLTHLRPRHCSHPHFPRLTTIDPPSRHFSISLWPRSCLPEGKSRRLLFLTFCRS